MTAVAPEPGTITEVEELPFIPDKTTVINPDGAVVETHPASGAVRITFILAATREAFIFNISPQAASAIKEELPASSSILTPPAPSIILPG